MVETTSILEGIVALVLGMSTVFIVLILISTVISLFQHFDFDNGIKLKSRKTKKTDEVMNLEEKIIENSVDNPENDLELIAVITAAIAASLETSTDKLEITSFRNISNVTRGSWTVRT